MTEYEQCMLMMLKEIKSQLSGINDGLYSISKELKQMNEYTGDEVDYGYDNEQHLKSISDSLARVYTIMNERV